MKTYFSTLNLFYGISVLQLSNEYEYTHINTAGLLSNTNRLEGLT